MVNHREELATRGKAQVQSRERTLQVVTLRDEGLLLWEIAERIGVTKERVRQILAKARAIGSGPKQPKQVVTRQATIMLGMSPEMRPASFQKLMAKLGVAPVAHKRGRLYWAVDGLLNIESPQCVVCQSPIPLSRYARSVTCKRECSSFRRSQYSSRRRDYVVSSKP